MKESKMILLTDVPIWSMPLVEALEAEGVRVGVVTDFKNVPDEGLLVNRVSAGSAATQPAFAESVRLFLQAQEQSGRQVINGAKSFLLGYDKLAQAAHFKKCGLQTPETHRVVSQQRQLPDHTVVFKPVSGGFGKGIVTAKAGEPVPESVTGSAQKMLEQEWIDAADGCVHRVEFLGDTLLYDAATRIEPGESNYCLTSTDRDSTLRTEIEPGLKEEVLRIARAAEMDFGSVEYLKLPSGEVSYIDLNPVSSYHPEAESMIGINPLQQCAKWLKSLQA